MKGKILTAAGLMLPAISFAAQQRPNIVFFLVDDYGWVDSQVAYGEERYPFNERFNTPNMLRLSQKGVIMTNAYACPLSTPTRTSLMTGMHAAHERITNFTHILRDTPSDGIGGTPNATAVADETDPFSRPDWNYNGISPFPDVPHTSYVTPLAGILRDNGYYTIHAGKAHWAGAGTPGSNPYNMGFVVNVGGSSNGQPGSYLGTENFGNLPGKWTYNAVQGMAQYYGDDIFLTEALTREALDRLDYPIESGKPFYLYLSHYATHSPITADSRYYANYRESGMDDGQSRFASMVEGVDKSLGDLMDYLERKGVADNTIIIFYADNGGKSDNLAKGGKVHEQNLPLREGKGSVYEGGVREPMMVYWPGKTAPGERINTPVSCEDFFPTILEMAGIRKYSTVQTIDGESFARLLSKGSKYVAKARKAGLITDQKSANSFVIPQRISGLDPQRPIISHYPHRWKLNRFEDIDYMSAVRVGNWKLVYRMETQAFELYDLSEDIAERNDLAPQHPDIVASLTRLLSERLRGWNACMPIVKLTGSPAPWPDEVLR